MSGSPLIAVPPAPADPPGAVVAGDGWWPDIDCAAMRDALRLGEIVTHARLIAAVEGGIIAIDQDLAEWRRARQREGAATLAEVAPTDTINNQPRLAILYTRAVRFAAAAEIAELHRDLGTTTKGDLRAESAMLTSADYRRFQIEAVRDILGTPRIAVDLI